MFIFGLRLGLLWVLPRCPGRGSNPLRSSNCRIFVLGVAVGQRQAGHGAKPHARPSHIRGPQPRLG
jgi:hypothetical protein